MKVDAGLQCQNCGSAEDPGQARSHAVGALCRPPRLRRRRGAQARRPGGKLRGLDAAPSTCGWTRTQGVPDRPDHRFYGAPIVSLADPVQRPSSDCRRSSGRGAKLVCVPARAGAVHCGPDLADPDPLTRWGVRDLCRGRRPGWCSTRPDSGYMAIPHCGAAIAQRVFMSYRQARSAGRMVIIADDHCHPRHPSPRSIARRVAFTSPPSQAQGGSGIENVGQYFDLPGLIKRGSLGLRTNAPYHQGEDPVGSCATTCGSRRYYEDDR